MQSSFDVCSNFNDISSKNELGLSETELENNESRSDDCTKNKNIQYQKGIDNREYEAAGINPTLTESDLIEIERQWTELENPNIVQLYEYEEYCDESESDDESIEPSYPIREVLSHSLVRKILMKSAAASFYYSTRNVCIPTSQRNQENKENNHYTKSLKKEVESKHSRLQKTDQRRASDALKSRENKIVASNTSKPEQNNTLYPRKHKTKIQTIIKKIEKELENDIGNGYGDAQWCQEYTKKRSEIQDQKEVNISERKDDFIPKLNKTSKTMIPTPSWRVVDDFDSSYSLNHNVRCESNTDDDDSDDSDSSYQSDSSLSSSCTWVPSDSVKEYIFPEAADIDLGLKPEVRLINLTENQIQAFCKKLLVGASTSVLEYKTSSVTNKTADK